MSVSIDFGSREIRSLVRAGVGGRLRLTTVRSDYILIPDAAAARKLLREEGLPHAVCASGLAVFGGGVERAEWLSRGPAVPLFVDGRIPTRDSLARQILGVLTESVLPEPPIRGSACVVSVPGAGLPRNLQESNEDFLGHLVQLRGYQPVFLSSAEAVLLASGAATGFSGICVAAGAESTVCCAARQGRVMAESGIPLGGRWLDSELARQFGEWTWDESGEKHANATALERWRLTALRNKSAPTDDRLSALSRLLSLITRRLAVAVRECLRASGVEWSEIPVMLAGGLSQMQEFRVQLQQELSGDGRTYYLQAVSDPETAVVRGGLIFGELASRSAA
ncbi:MAG: hypothetical protein RLZZ436_1334 [Planctomycetota bacterium]|jgi:hypothetical protein